MCFLRNLSISKSKGVLKELLFGRTSLLFAPYVLVLAPLSVQVKALPIFIYFSLVLLFLFSIMGLITIYTNPTNIVYKIILNHDDVATGAISYLNECRKNISPHHWRQEETTSAFGGKEITIKLSYGCNVTALSLVNHLKRKLGYHLFAVTPVKEGSANHFLFVLDYAPK